VAAAADRRVLGRDAPVDTVLALEKRPRPHWSTAGLTLTSTESRPVDDRRWCNGGFSVAFSAFGETITRSPRVRMQGLLLKSLTTQLKTLLDYPTDIRERRQGTVVEHAKHSCKASLMGERAAAFRPKFQLAKLACD
jgi:hypothetical protein